jgi:hypothetical protein
MLWRRVGEDKAASVEVEVARENHRAAGSSLSENRINCQFCITQHSSEPRKNPSLSVSEPLPNPEAGKLSVCALP